MNISDMEVNYEDKASLFDINSTKRQEEILNQYIESISKEFLADTSVRNNPPTKSQIKNSFSDFQVPQNSKDLSKYFEELTANIVSKTTRCSSPLLIGHMSTALPYFQRPLSKLITSMNQNTVKLETASFTSFLERETLAKLHHSFYKMNKAFYTANAHNAGSSLGCITSGGTLANFTAMWAARNIALGPIQKNGATVFEGIEKEGLFSALKAHGYEGACIIGSEMMHYSLKKVADMLGLGTSGITSIPIDEKFCIRTDLLHSKIQELKSKKILIIGIVGVAGTTETGSVDNLQEIGNLCKKYNIYFHVDAAWGGPFIFSRKHSKKLLGIEMSDSVTIDGHKQLYTPMGCGIILFKNPSVPLSFRKTANYIIRSDSLDLGKFSPEGSRPANVIYLHASLSILGVEGMEQLMDRGCEMIDYLSSKIQSHKEFELVSVPMLNILLYRWIPEEFYEKKRLGKLTREDEEKINEKNAELQTIIASRGDSFISRTTVNSVRHGGKVTSLRAVITNPTTTKSHIDFAISEQLHFIRNFSRLDSASFKPLSHSEYVQGKNSVVAAPPSLSERQTVQETLYNNPGLFTEKKSNRTKVIVLGSKGAGKESLVENLVRCKGVNTKDTYVHLSESYVASQLSSQSHFSKSSPKYKLLVSKEVGKSSNTVEVLIPNDEERKEILEKIKRKTTLLKETSNTEQVQIQNQQSNKMKTILMVVWKISEGEQGLLGLDFWFKLLSPYLPKPQLLQKGQAQTQVDIESIKDLFSFIVIGTYSDQQQQQQQQQQHQLSNGSIGSTAVTQSDEAKKERKRKVKEMMDKNGLFFNYEYFEVSVSSSNPSYEKVVTTIAQKICV